LELKLAMTEQDIYRKLKAAAIAIQRGNHGDLTILSNQLIRNPQEVSFQSFPSSLTFFSVFYSIGRRNDSNISKSLGKFICFTFSSPTT
jgi:hypothetical protein